MRTRSPPTYHITATLSATTAVALDNYIITNDGAEFTINKRLATWTTNPASKTYGDPDPSPLTTGSGTNFVAADNVTATYSRVAGENAQPADLSHHGHAERDDRCQRSTTTSSPTMAPSSPSTNALRPGPPTRPARPTVIPIRAADHRQRLELRRGRQRDRDLQRAWLVRMRARRPITSRPR